MKSWLWLIAGPDGAGRTTYAVRHLRSSLGTVHFLSLHAEFPGKAGLAALPADLGRVRAWGGLSP